MKFQKMHAAGMFLVTVFVFPVPAAQTSAKVEFEVASIKPAEPVPVQIATGRRHVGMKVDGARVDIGTASLGLLIQNAYGVEKYQVSVPASLDRAQFDILAKIPEGAGKQQVPEMLQSLLADRFKLAFHREKREVVVYAIVMDKGGPKLKKPVDEPEGAAPTPRQNGTMVAQTAGGDQVRLASGGDGVLRVESPRMRMAALAEFIQRFADRPVVDLTALNGDFQIAFETSIWGMTGRPRAADAADTAPDPGAGLIFESIQKLGLRLEARKFPIEIIVVDSAEKDPIAD